MLTQILRTAFQQLACFAVLIALPIAVPRGLAAEPFEEALDRLRAVGEGTASQAQIKEDWDVVAGVGADRLTDILAAMESVGPLAENWLRGAADTIAERELRSSAKLPVAALEEFVLDSDQSPRARRTAFEWLTRVDPTAPDRLLPRMLDDQSLEIRHDAVARLLANVENTTEGEEKLRQLRRAFGAARSLEQAKHCIEQLQQLGKLPNLAEHFGYVTSWRAIGPFDNVGGVGFDAIYPPETEIDFSQQYQGKNGKVSWKELETQGKDIEKVGVVDLNETLVEEKEVAAYVVATFVSPREQTLECRYGTVNANKLWVNGELLINKDVYHMGGEFDQYIAAAKFRRGENTILLKICQNELISSWSRPWEFRLRVTDDLGGGVGQATGSE